MVIMGVDEMSIGWGSVLDGVVSAVLFAGMVFGVGSSCSWCW